MIVARSTGLMFVMWKTFSQPTIKNYFCLSEEFLFDKKTWSVHFKNEVFHIKIIQALLHCLRKKLLLSKVWNFPLKNGLNYQEPHPLWKIRLLHLQSHQRKNLNFHFVQTKNWNETAAYRYQMKLSFVVDKIPNTKSL